MEVTIIATLAFSIIHLFSEWLALDYLNDTFQILGAEYFRIGILISTFVNGGALFLLIFKAFVIAKSRWINKIECVQTEIESNYYYANCEDGKRESSFAVFCGTFFLLMALMNSAQCAFSVHMTFQFSNENAILHFKNGIYNLQNFYGKIDTITLALDRIQENNKCCGLNNAIFEYRYSDWFRLQRRSPRRQLPSSCAVVERTLNFITIKSRQNRTLEEDAQVWRPNLKILTQNPIKRIVEKINIQKGKRYGCFDEIRRRTVAIGTVMSMSSFACALAQLAHAFQLLFKSLGLNGSSMSKLKLLPELSSSEESLTM